ncbi:MAG: hypothetical protein GX556_05195 [Fibrobacter sp.]|nr:hypothetical protein [Fibrobacter sp.]
MFKQMFVFLIGLAIVSADAQSLDLQGVISNNKGQPVNDAIVSLVRLKMIDTTSTDGRYAFIGTSVSRLPAIMPQADGISLNNNMLKFSLSAPSNMKVEIFDLKGNLIMREIKTNAATGTYQFDISKNCQTSNVLLIKASTGRSETSFRYMPLSGRAQALSLQNGASTISNSRNLAKMADALDTIMVTATGFVTKYVAINNLVNQQQNITLDSSDGKNAPVPSSGCGKDLGTINNSGIFNLNGRKFIVNLPTNYDKNKPYRLVFGMHCMGGSAEKVAGNSDQSKNFYGIKTQADKDGIQCIYVAPQGDDGGTWSANRDIPFFDELQKHLKNNLCVDTTRVFSVGFSFGAMYTYALSLKYPGVLRAAACNAPANWNFDPQPPRPGKDHPIAYIQTTGTRDGLCSWVYNDGQKKGGKYCLLQHAEDNGCNTNIEIKLANSGTHVVTEFEGCKDGYPVRFMSHNGEHWCNATDQGTNFDWIPVEFWNFFKRF